MAKKALVTGVTGQDGSYLAELLLKKGYEVHGLVRRSSLANTGRIDHMIREGQEPDARLFLHHGDLTDSTNIVRIIQEIRPDEIYNLAAMSHVRVSFDTPEYTGNVDGLGVLRILEAIRLLGLEKTTRFYQASTSELFGRAAETPQSEKTPFYPRSPYGIAKQYGFWMTVNYREAFRVFGSNGILFNHESPRRGETFVTRKITLAAAAIKRGRRERLSLGNLDAKRDWGYAGDYVEAMWLMLQHEEPDDFVIASGECHSVKEFVELAFQELGMAIRWEGEGVDEKGYDRKTDQCLVEIDPRYFRPTEVDLLLGDPTKAKEKLGWKPKTTFPELVHLMVRADYENLK